MRDRYKMLIWAKPKSESIEEQVSCAYGILSKLKEYKLFEKLLLPAKSKKEVKEFDITEKHIEELILNKRDKKYMNLGSLLSFFTSLNQESSMSVLFSVGRSNSKFRNVMVISLPINFTSSELIESIELLKDLVRLYKAFYACITSNMNLELYDDFYDFAGERPKVAFWVNYWGKEIIKNIKMNEEVLEAVYEYEMTEDGCYIRLQNEPIDISNNQHIEFQNKINSMLNL